LFNALHVLSIRYGILHNLMEINKFLEIHLSISNIFKNKNENYKLKILYYNKELRI